MTAIVRVVIGAAVLIGLVMAGYAFFGLFALALSHLGLIDEFFAVWFVVMVVLLVGMSLRLFYVIGSELLGR